MWVPSRKVSSRLYFDEAVAGADRHFETSTDHKNAGQGLPPATVTRFQRRGTHESQASGEKYQAEQGKNSIIVLESCDELRIPQEWTGRAPSQRLLVYQPQRRCLLLLPGNIQIFSVSSQRLFPRGSSLPPVPQFTRVHLKKKQENQPSSFLTEPEIKTSQKHLYPLDVCLQ
ncbi:uncharacterized protein LOC113601256 isoform X2 [Acinonyx jubatus]|uniref:Uncharacterized protein LOC113601256 isoform X2 n=1 Tax=Acinonyx jubatus TaxID=32536 RepID=A0ABM3PLN5_ACIJB|nr:uncharacterized protein LOC113601256 isoform X2 [Acinonyx jubatus]